MTNVLVAYTANKKIAEQLREEERKLDLQRMKMVSRISREKTELFDTLVSLNVRTPHHETKSTDSERVKLAQVELDDQVGMSRALSLHQRKRLCQKRVTPVIELAGSDVYFQLQEDADTRRKLETNSRTSTLLHKSKNIALCLEALSVAEDNKEPTLTRSKTFTAVEKSLPSIPYHRASTSIETLKGSSGVEDVLPTSAWCRNPRKVIDNRFELYSKRETDASCRKLGFRHLETITQREMKEHGHSVTESGRSRQVESVQDNPIHSFKNLVYFNLWCMRTKTEKSTESKTRPVKVRQSLLKHYVPIRGVPNVKHGRMRSPSRYTLRRQAIISKNTIER